MRGSGRVRFAMLYSVIRDVRYLTGPGFTEYFHVFCPSGLRSQFKFNPIEFSRCAASRLRHFRSIPYGVEKGIVVSVCSAAP